MAVVKFDQHQKLDEYIARIYLDTHQKFTKKDMLELIFNIGSQDYLTLLDKVNNNQEPDNLSLRKEFIKTFAGCLSIENEDENEVNPKKIWEKGFDELDG